MTQKEKDRIEAITHLREWFKPGDRVCIILRHVSRSGMMRAISVIDRDNNDVSWAVARALGWNFDRKTGGVKVNGCGMDMGFHLVYSLSYVLYPGGFGCTGKGCPSCDHSNGDRDYTPHNHEDGGYALTSRWL